MKSSSLAVALCGLVKLSRASCGNNCARQIIASAFTTRHGAADCSAYLATTVTPATVTFTHTITDSTTIPGAPVPTSHVTVTETVTASTETNVIIAEVVATSTEVDIFTITETDVASTETDVAVSTVTVTTVVAPLAKRVVTLLPSAVPAYASGCSSFAAYSSACASCLGVTGTTVVAPAPSTTVTVTVWSTATSAMPKLTATDTVVDSVTATTLTTSTLTSLTTFTTVTIETDVESITATTLVTSTATEVVTSTSAGPQPTQPVNFCLKVITPGLSITGWILTRTGTVTNWIVQQQGATTYPIARLNLDVSTGLLTTGTADKYPGYVVTVIQPHSSLSNVRAYLPSTCVTNPAACAKVYCSTASGAYESGTALSCQATATDVSPNILYTDFRSSDSSATSAKILAMSPAGYNPTSSSVTVLDFQFGIFYDADCS
ncbi:hypothetical protein NKR23_g6827 [Pleurostoma richardsiae]|uniref:Uncharacterized protein n=1 Tax=Pleurostoma richardsiae TaxID=41990 RepID=A0AA38VRW4_9PEZI|nr:hypothetical protein NKR23_g6827 [Pleurostoma richardsiae]